MSRGVLDDLMCGIASQGSQPRDELNLRRVRICAHCGEDWFRCEHKAHLLLAPPPTERGRVPYQREKALG